MDSSVSYSVSAREPQSPPGVLYVRFLRGRGSFTDLERWQTQYLPVYAIWAAIVVIVFPPVFGYI